MRIALIELDGIDHFLRIAEGARISEKRALDQLASSFVTNGPDDWLSDDVAQLDQFALLSVEFSIVGLWRCIELYREVATRIAYGTNIATKVFRHRDFQQQLKSLGIVESEIRCARSVDELRCLNNAIKHSQRVSAELALFPRWKDKEGENLANLEPHYRRFRPLAERYLRNLSVRLDRVWKRKERMTNPSR